MTNTDSIIGLVNQIVASNFRYSLPREGQVKSVTDSAGKGRILVVIPSLGWDTEDKGAWCYSLDKNSLTTVKIDDWVIVQFLDGNRDYPLVMGKSTRIQDQLPTNYSDENTQIIFEDPNDETVISYSSSEEELKIGYDEFEACARVEDTTISSSSEDNTFWTFWNAFFSIITGASIPEPGNGSPSALQTALATAISGAGGTPIEINGKINSGSEKVKVGTK